MKSGGNCTGHTEWASLECSILGWLQFFVLLGTSKLMKTISSSCYCLYLEVNGFISDMFSPSVLPISLQHKAN